MMTTPGPEAKSDAGERTAVHSFLELIILSWDDKLGTQVTSLHGPGCEPYIYM
jgi:hypothetical protein